MRRLSAWGFALLLAAGCTDAEAPTFHVEALASPAGEGSGEPFLSPQGDGVLMSWLERAGEAEHALRVARLADGAWSEPQTVERRADFFVNWADFPSVTAGSDGTVWAHWLERGAEGGYDYGVRIVRSTDGGRTWGDPWTPHEDGTPTEHGFVSTYEHAGAIGFAWLDGRETAGHGDGHGRGAMTLRTRTVTADGVPGPGALIDDRVCDCCQTDAAVAADGPVVVYRDRSPDEIRDIYLARWVDGAWTEGVPVHRDGWHIGGCPVNGPAVAASGRNVVVAWFTAAEDVPRVRVAFSDDGGATFAAPFQIDDGNPGGRVDVMLDVDGSALVSWLERTGGEDAAVRIRRVRPDGATSASATVAESSSARGSGFPRLAPLPDDRVLVAWTDAAAGRVRVATVSLGAG